MNWISVKDYLPKKDYLLEVICTLKDETVFPLTWRGSKFCFYDGNYTDLTEEVTHWMPLPEPPKKAETPHVIENES
jgi:hypothetical protein